MTPLAFLCISVLVQFFAAAPASASQSLFDFFGHTGSTAGQFAKGVETETTFEPGASGIAVNDTTGDIYVVDRVDNRVEQFDSDENFIRAWGVDTIPGGASGTGTLTSGSAEVTSVVTLTKAFIPGQEVSGTGIPSGTTIREVITGAGAASKLILSEKATASGSGVTITAAASGANVPQNEIQKVSLKAAANNFKLKFTTTMPTAEATTGNIAFNASAATVQSALEGLANIGAGNVEVTGPNGGPYSVEFKGKFADTNVAQMTKVAGSPDLSGPPGPTVAIVTEQEGAGSFEECTAATTCQSGAATGANGGLNKPLSVAVSQSNQNVYVSDMGNLRVDQYEANGTFVRAWGANVVRSGPGDKPEVQSLKVTASSGTFVLGYEGAANNTTATGTGTYTSGSNEITALTTSAGNFTVGKQISGAGIPAGTTITSVEPGKLFLSTNTTEAKTATSLSADLPYNASAATVEAALNALNTVGGALGSIAVTGGPGDATGSNPYQLTFGGALANVDAAEVTLSTNSLGVAEGTALSCGGGPEGASLSYQWLRGGTAISGATNATYTTVAADAGQPIQCQVKASNGEGATLKTTSGALVSPVPSVIPPVPPTGGPTISGTATVGQTLTCANGTWTGSGITFSTRWLRNGVPIAGATSTTYVLQAADNETAIQCEVTGTNAGGSAVADSSGKIIRSEPPANTGVPGTAPTITGTASVGNVLTCASGTWTPASPAPTFTYQWLRNGAEIGGATASTYTTVVADEGAAVQCKVTATNAAGAAGTAVSGNTVIAPVPNPTPPVRPSAAISVTGTRNVGQILTCASGTWTPASPAPTFAFQWLRNGVSIAGATANTYTQVAADLDKQLQCRVTATNTNGASVAFSAVATSAGGITVAAPPTAAATITPPSSATTVREGASTEVCNAGVDTCQAGITPGNTAKRFGGTFASGTNAHMHVAVAPGGPYGGDIFVSDGGNERMQIFNPNTGGFIAAFGKEVIQSGPETFGKNVCLASLGDVCKGGVSVVAANSYGFAGTDEVQPSSFAIDSTGAIYAMGKWSAYLQKYSPDLSSEQDFAPSFCTTPNISLEAKILGCSEVAIDPETDDVYVVRGITGKKEVCFGEICANTNFLKERAMARLDPTGSEPPLEEMLEGNEVQNINGIAVDGSTGNERSGRVYFTTNSPEQRVDILGEPTPPTFSFDPIQESDVADREVTVRATINPNGDKIHTNYRFETLRQGGTWTPFPVPNTDIGNGTSPEAIEETITGLRPNTHYRIRLAVFKGARNLSSEQTFTTKFRGPDVETTGARWSGPPSSNPSLTFSGTVDDNNVPVHYYFEYGTDTSYGSRVPIFETGNYPASEEAFVGRQTVTGLDPGNTYHYRIVARSSSGTAFGSDREIGPAESGGRYPELVSPPDKGVGKVGVTLGPGGLGQLSYQGAANGNRIAYAFEYGDTEAESGGELVYLGKRGNGAWENEQLNPPSSAPPLGAKEYNATPASPGLVKWQSPNLTCGFVQSRGKVTPDVPSLDVENNIWQLFRRNDNDGTFTRISPSPLNVGNYGYKVRGATPDCSRVIFQTANKLLPGMPVAEGIQHIYEWEETGAGTGVTRVVDVLPDGSIPAGGALRVEEGNLHDYQGGEVEMNAVSEPDASRAFFFATSDEGADSGHKAIFLRKNHAVTIDVSQSQTAVPNTGSTEFQMASTDGSHVFFTAIAGLASNSTTTTGNSLYDYNVNTGVLLDLTPNTNAANTAGAQVEGVLGASNNGSHVYFAAKGQLVTGQGKTYAENNAGSTNNVYLAQGGGLSLVGIITNSDGHEGSYVAGPSINPPNLIESRVTASGDYLLFKSSVNLTSYNSEGHTELYRYSASGSPLVCISCRTDGQPPELGSNTEERSMVVYGSRNQGNDYYHPRAMTEDGETIFFFSADKLTPDATHTGNRNAYEWHDGTVHLLANNAIVLDSSADGSSVFITTTQALVPQDHDAARDIYVLRTNGGFPYSPPEPCDPLTEGSCQGNPPAPPTPGAEPASSGFNGPGNPPAAKPKPAKCKKGQVRRQGKCVNNKKHRKQKKKAKRAARHHRGGSK